MSLPHSDGISVKAYPGETTEAFCDGRVSAFGFLGGVPLVNDKRSVEGAKQGHNIRLPYNNNIEETVRWNYRPTSTWIFRQPAAALDSFGLNLTDLAEFWSFMRSLINEDGIHILRGQWGNDHS